MTIAERRTGPGSVTGVAKTQPDTSHGAHAPSVPLVHLPVRTSTDTQGPIDVWTHTVQSRDDPPVPWSSGHLTYAPTCPHQHRHPRPARLVGPPHVRRRVVAHRVDAREGQLPGRHGGEGQPQLLRLGQEEPLRKPVG